MIMYGCHNTIPSLMTFSPSSRMSRSISLSSCASFLACEPYNMVCNTVNDVFNLRNNFCSSCLFSFTSCFHKQLRFLIEGTEEVLPLFPEYVPDAKLPVPCVDGIPMLPLWLSLRHGAPFAYLHWNRLHKVLLHF